MKITLELNAKDRLEALVSFIEKRAADPVHQNNGDVIADFLDKFIVVELKRLESTPEFLPMDTEIPDEVLTEPMMEMKKALDDAFNGFMNGNGMTPMAAPTQSGSDVSQTATAIAPAPRPTQSTPRNGNGHASNMKRKLNDDEKNLIRERFLDLNGEFEDSKKSCTEMLSDPVFGTDVTVWQITGFVSYLHREIAAGKWTVPNMDSYRKFLQGHKDLWSQYNSPKYQNLRAKNTAGVSMTPRFKRGTFPKKTI